MSSSQSGRRGCVSEGCPPGPGYSVWALDQGQLADWLTHTRKTYSRKSTTLNDSSRQLNTTQDILGCFDLLVFVLCIHVLCAQVKEYRMHWGETRGDQIRQTYLLMSLLIRSRHSRPWSSVISSGTLFTLLSLSSNSLRVYKCFTCSASNLNLVITHRAHTG